MPNISIMRKWRTANSVCGVLVILPVFQCFTLEPPSPISAGVYQAKIEQSPRLSELEGRPIFTPRLYGVPGFPNNDVLIHFGNYPRDTEGCTLVGLTRAIDFVGESQDAFAQMMALLSGEFQVTYLDVFNS